MIRRLACLALAAALAACTPAPVPSASGQATGSDYAGDDRPQTVEACAVVGGRMQPVCRRQTEVCVVAFADAGKPCTDGDQCQGDCRAEPSDRPPALNDADVRGVCQADSDPCGCFTTIEDGRPERTICVD